MTTETAQYVGRLLEPRLSESARAFYASAVEELGQGVSRQRFSALLAMASRHAKRQPLELSDAEREQASQVVPGWCPDAWNRLELLRAGLILARPDSDQPAFAEDFESLFRFADEGETCALYRCLPLLPAGERFASRAAEGCRTNMQTVFEAIALDSPYPVNYFNDTAWHQLVIKALFLDLPVYRIVGLDRRLDAELTRMALDWADERVSAGRSFHRGLWLCFGPHHGQRVETLINTHWPAAEPAERHAMGLALARAGLSACLAQKINEEQDAGLRAELQKAHEGHCDQRQFGPLF